jgi:branched-chain amino acid transport system ATP-binding protein
MRGCVRCTSGAKRMTERAQAIAGGELEVRALSAGYGSAVVLEGVSFTLRSSSSLALLGRNGVGKTTLITSLMGLTHRFAGSVRLGSVDLSRRGPFDRARAGLGWVPQERGVFASLSVVEHLTTVARPGPWTLDAVWELFPSLASRRKNRGDQLSGGEQQMLAIGRALVTNPRVLLLDEPMEGLAPVIVEELTRVIRRLQQQGGMSLVLVEQHAKLALSLTDDVIVLDRGRIVHQSRSATLSADPALQRELFTPGASTRDR